MKLWIKPGLIFKKDLDHLEEQVSSGSYGFSNYNVVFVM